MKKYDYPLRGNNFEQNLDYYILSLMKYEKKESSAADVPRVADESDDILSSDFTDSEDPAADFDAAVPALEAAAPEVAAAVSAFEAAIPETKAAAAGRTDAVREEPNQPLERQSRNGRSAVKAAIGLAVCAAVIGVVLFVMPRNEPPADDDAGIGMTETTTAVEMTETVTTGIETTVAGMISETTAAETSETVTETTAGTTVGETTTTEVTLPKEIEDAAAGAPLHGTTANTPNAPNQNQHAATATTAAPSESNGENYLVPPKKTGTGDDLSDGGDG